MACGSECNQEVGDAIVAAVTAFCQNNQAYSGDPVNVVTGAFSHSEQDVTLPNQRLPVVLNRHYNNQQHQVLPESQLRPFGPGWTFSFGLRLEPQHDGSVIFIDDRGARLLFVIDHATTLFRPPPGSLGMQLRRFPNGRSHLRQITGLTAEFDCEGRFVGLTQPGPKRDSRLLLEYDGAGRLSAVRGVGKCGLEFKYQSAFLISEVRDHSNRCWRYTYNEHSELETVCDPAGRIRRYLYDGWTGRIASGRKTTDTKSLRALRTVFAFSSSSSHVPPPALVTNSYTTEQRVHLQTDAQGNVTRFEYNPFARTTAVTDPSGHSTLYCFDEAGSTTKVRSPEGGTTEYVFDDQRNLLAEINPLCQRTEYVDFRLPQLLDQQAAFGRRAIGNRSSYLSLSAGDLICGYDSDGNRPLIRDPAGRTTRFADYTAFGQPQLTTLPDGSMIHVEFDVRSGLPLRRTRELRAGRTIPLRSIEEWKYDDVGNCILHRAWAETLDGQQSTPTRVEEFQYEPELQQLAVHRRWTEQDGKGQSFASEVHYEWDSLGRLIEETSLRRESPEGQSEPCTTRYSYDILGQRISEVRPDGSVIVMEYDIEGRLTESFLLLDPIPENLFKVPIERRINRYRVAYDTLGRPVQLTSPSGGVTTRVWDECGRCTVTSDPYGVATNFQYDRDGRLIQESLGSGQTTHFEYDATGRETRRANNLGVDRRTTRDVLGRPVSVSSLSDGKPSVIKYSYDSLGHIDEIHFADNTYETLAYDEFDNLIRRDRGQCGHPPDSVEARTYDGLGRLIRVDSGQAGSLRCQIRYEYFDPNREIKSFDALGNLTRSQYDTEYRLLRRCDAEGRTVEFQYDWAGRLIRRWSGDGSVDSRWTHDARGFLASATESDVTYYWSYDAGGRVLMHQQAICGDSRAIQYKYDPLGRLVEKHFDEKWWVKLTYSASPLPRQIIFPDNQVAFEYDPANRIKEERWLNGGRTTYEYSSDGYLKALRCTGRSEELVWEQSFVRDCRQRPASELRRSDASQVTLRYQYDSLNRLREWVSRGSDGCEQVFVIGYDSYNNRTSERHSDTVCGSYSYDLANRLLLAERGSDSTQYSYDRCGLLVADGVHIFQYDAAHRLRSVLTQDGRSVAHFRYSATGDVAVVSRDMGLERRFYDGKHEIVCTSPAGRINSYWGLRGDCLLATRRGASAPERVYADALGSILGVAGEKPFAQYAPFGASLNIPIEIGFGFGSKRYEPSAGMYLNGARLYDPVAGRFVQPDPMGLVDGPNLYRYARNNPLVYEDSTGFESRPLSQGRVTNLLLGLELTQFPGQTEGRTHIVRAGWFEATPLRAESMYAKHYDANGNLLGRSYIVHPGLLDFGTVPHVEHRDANWNVVDRTYIEGPGFLEALSHARHYDADWNTLGRSYLVGPGLLETSPHIERYDTDWDLQASTYVEGPGLFESRSHLQHYGTRGSVGSTYVVPARGFEPRHFHRRA